MDSVIHRVEVGSVSATVSSARVRGLTTYRIDVQVRRGKTGAKTRTRQDDTCAAGLARALFLACKLVEYLYHGFRLEVWREDYDPTYDPEHPSP
jgi:hypothetical protein